VRETFVDDDDDKLSHLARVEFSIRMMPFEFLGFLIARVLFKFLQLIVILADVVLNF